MHSPKLLILDEPTNGLDPVGIKSLRDILKEISKKQKVAVFVSSHILTEMELMCDKVAVINKGKMVRVEEIGEHTKKEEKIQVIITVRQKEEAKEVLEKKDIEVEIKEDKIHIKAQADKVPEIVKLLVKNDIDIEEVIKKEKSLEDIFFGATNEGGKKNENN